ENGSRILKELKLYEFSAVTMAANPLAKLESIKSQVKDSNDRISKMLKLFRNGELTDETFSLMEIALKQMQLQAFELGKQEIKSTQENEPSNDTQELIEPQVIKSIFNEFKI